MGVTGEVFREGWSRRQGQDFNRQSSQRDRETLFDQRAEVNPASPLPLGACFLASAPNAPRETASSTAHGAQSQEGESSRLPALRCVYLGRKRCLACVEASRHGGTSRSEPPSAILNSGRLVWRDVPVLVTVMNSFTQCSMVRPVAQQETGDRRHGCCESTQLAVSPKIVMPLRS